ncbi:uncharacterized protein LOC116929280 [Daphnia magna]|uniref:uncharacterized protein LOC116929280 n=1 Tax=Daphnia magna TaxID=35525 RepID=UPI001E1BA4D5|nr:uncharacterized protein LOC116929280 [Daphnia magna]
MKLISILLLVSAMFLVQLVAVSSAPVTLIVGTPYLFNKFDYKVDPNRGAELSPAFQQQHGPFGQNLVNSFGNGNL